MENPELQKYFVRLRNVDSAFVAANLNEKFTKHFIFPIQKRFHRIYMMKQTNNYSTMSIPDLNAEAIEVKYMGGKNSMIIMLPNTIDGLPFLEKNLKV